MLLPGEVGQRDAVVPPVEPDPDAVVRRCPRGRADRPGRLAEQLDGPLLEHAGPDAVLDVVAAPGLQHDRLDAPCGEQVGQESPAGPAPTIPTCVRMRPRGGAASERVVGQIAPHRHPLDLGERLDVGLRRRRGGRRAGRPDAAERVHDLVAHGLVVDVDDAARDAVGDLEAAHDVVRQDARATARSRCPLASFTASSSESNATTGATGPKISSWYAGESVGTSASTVGR